MTIQGAGATPNSLIYQGRNRFHPAGAHDCVVAFSVEEPMSRRVVITTPAPLLTAERI